MQVTRAVRQLQKLNLIELSKEGVQVVMQGKANHRALFESAEPYLLDPVREIVYAPRDARIAALPLAGLNMLSEQTMLSPPTVTTFAHFSKTDKISGGNALTDREKLHHLLQYRAFSTRPWRSYAHGKASTVFGGMTNPQIPRSLLRVWLLWTKDDGAGSGFAGVPSQLSLYSPTINLLKVCHCGVPPCILLAIAFCYSFSLIKYKRTLI
jgi:hypothetical protein